MECKSHDCDLFHCIHCGKHIEDNASICHGCYLEKLETDKDDVL